MFRSNSKQNTNRSSGGPRGHFGRRSENRPGSFSRGTSFSTHGGSRAPFRGGHGSGSRSRGQRRGGFAYKGIDVSRYVNKAVITEEIEHFVPEHSFADFAIDNKLKALIFAKGYKVPTPIQDRTIPHILRGSDVVGIANTGTGKTAAFLIPLINTALKNHKEKVLIMVPTRELAQQINEEFIGFSRGLSIYSAVCVGGASIGFQMRELRRYPQFVIGTPGRLKDLIDRRSLILSDFKTAVLDEADRMLDMGFINDMRQVLALLPSPRHTLFFSATISSQIEKLIGEFMKEPVRISVKTREILATIEQDVVRVPSGAVKFDVLRDLLLKPEFSKVLIFGRTKHGVDRLSKALIEKGVKAESIHGDKNQNRRQKALDLFKRDHVNVLVATDVAARGLDIAGVSHVINYDLPGSHEDYIHRIGRTGRAGKKGKALTFIE
ncbi:MAG: DEAD/DEAH box helicase [Patescibacteria group bacterium]